MGVLEELNAFVLRTSTEKVKSISTQTLRKVFARGQPDIVSYTSNGGVLAAYASCIEVFAFGLQPDNRCVSVLLSATNLVSAEVNPVYAQTGTARVQGGSSGALLGAALLGTTGAIIGSAGSKTVRSSGTLRESSGILSVYTTDVLHPVVTFEFPLISTAREWQARLAGLPARSVAWYSERIRAEDRIDPATPTRTTKINVEEMAAAQLKKSRVPPHILCVGWDDGDNDDLALALRLSTKGALAFSGWQISTDTTARRLTTSLMDLDRTGYLKGGVAGPDARKHIVFLKHFDQLNDYDVLVPALQRCELNPDPFGGVSWLPDFCLLASADTIDHIPEQIVRLFKTKYIRKPASPILGR